MLREGLLDGAMGTALLARGLPAETLPDEWVLSRPEAVAEVHAEHGAAGARILLTCTFSCAAPRLEARLAPDRIDALCASAPRLARSAAPGALVAGALGPTGLAPPLGPGPSPEALEARYALRFEALARGGADLLWAESQHDLGEALAAVRAARRTGLPVAVTFTLVERGGALAAHDGSDPLAWLAASEVEGAAAIGVNCVFPGAALDALAARASATLRVPFVAKPSPGLPGAVLPPDAFAARLRGAIVAGARIVGGCCGATGDHLRAIGAAMAALRTG